jgi:cold shock CspA family protein
MATYRDQLLACVTCGKPFFFTVTDQRRLDQEGKDIEAPTLCPNCLQLDPISGKQRGQIKWFRLEKGYGFVRTLGGDELFFHQSHTLETNLSKLKKGAEVLFKVETTPKGPEAVQVELVDEKTAKPSFPEREETEGMNGIPPSPEDVED